MGGRTGPLPGSGGTELDRLRSTVSAYFPVYETQIGPQSLLLAVHTDRATLEGKFDRLRVELWNQGYVPFLRHSGGEEFIEVVRRPKLGARRPWTNLALLGGTFATTVLAGALIWLTYTGQLSLTVTDFGYGALYFAAPVMAILGIHEFAHYWVARRRHLDASFPYFLPVPPPIPFGTFGAFVSIRSPFPDRKTLFDVGAAGPLAGFAAAIPVALAGLYVSIHSPLVPASYCGITVLGQSYGNLFIGSSFFWSFLTYFFPPGIASLHHPLALAGWVGVLVTAINLLPAGSLDGGHIFRALLGDRSRFVSYSAAILLFGLGFFYTGWLIFAVLVLFLGLRHPAPLNDLTPLDTKRYVVGGLVAAILVAGFVVVPLAEPWAVGLAGQPVGYPHSLPPGAAVAANFSALVENQNPIAHAYDLSVSVSTVEVNGSGGHTVNLTGAALANWSQNATWTFVLPAGVTAGPFTGNAGSVSDPDSFAVNASSSLPVLVKFSDTQPALMIEVTLSANTVCAPSGQGGAQVRLTATFTATSL